MDFVVLFKMDLKYLRFMTVCVCLLLGVSGNFTEFDTSAARAGALKEAKALSPFTLVKILNDRCDAGNGEFGTCMARTECIWKGGIGYNTCGKGFGVCCVITAIENGVAFGNNTRLYKSSFNEGVEITYTVLRMNDDICQFRLDVKALILYKPETSGNCFNDYMTVDQDTKFSKVCGLSRDIHYYFEISDKYAIFTFHTNGGKSFDREWEIYVSQYTCDSGAPAGCGQWYWGQSGKIELWNNIHPSDNVWFYIEDQQYSVCIRWEAGYCSITYYESEAFVPKCNDEFERPSDASTTLRDTCALTPPASPVSYTLDNGVQSFYVRFTDSSNSHINSLTNTFKNPSILYAQNVC